MSAQDEYNKEVLYSMCRTICKIFEENEYLKEKNKDLEKQVEMYRESVNRRIKLQEEAHNNLMQHILNKDITINLK